MEALNAKNLSHRTAVKNKNYWQEIMNQWEASNETQHVFCERLGITRGTFSYWRHVLSKKNRKEINSFIPLRISKPKINSSDKIIIKSPSGYKIILNDITTSPETVQSVFKLLGLINA